MVLAGWAAVAVAGTSPCSRYNNTRISSSAHYKEIIDDEVRLDDAGGGIVLSLLSP